MRFETAYKRPIDLEWSRGLAFVKTLMFEISKEYKELTNTKQQKLLQVS